MKILKSYMHSEKSEYLDIFDQYLDFSFDESWLTFSKIDPFRFLYPDIGCLNGLKYG